MRTLFSASSAPALSLSLYLFLFLSWPKRASTLSTVLLSLSTSSSTSLSPSLSHCFLHEESIELLRLHLGEDHKLLQVSAEIGLELFPEGHLVHLAVNLPKATGDVVACVGGAGGPIVVGSTIVPVNMVITAPRGSRRLCQVGTGRTTAPPSLISSVPHYRSKYYLLSCSTYWILAIWSSTQASRDAC